MRTKQEVDLAIFRMKQTLKSQGCQMDNASIAIFVQPILHEKVKICVEQLIESWSLSDIVLFLRGLEEGAGELPKPELNEINASESPKKRGRPPKTAH